MLADRPTLQVDHIDFFGREGYLILNDVIAEQELGWLRGLLLGLFERRDGHADGYYFDMAAIEEEGEPECLPQILHPSRYAPALGDASIRQYALAIGRTLLGEGARMTLEHAILKPAYSGGETPWHQDEAFWSPDRDYEAVSLWLPLQEVTLENGCLHFLPGSHAGEVVPHRSVRPDTRVHGLEAVAVDQGRSVACPLRPGGATVHHCRTLHYAGPNRTPEPRLSYTFVLGVAPVPRARPRVFPWQRDRKTAAQRRLDTQGNRE